MPIYQYCIHTWSVNAVLIVNHNWSATDIAAYKGLIPHVDNSLILAVSYTHLDVYKRQLSQYAQISILNNEGRWNIAEVIYDLYRNNTYILNKNGYIIQ